MPRATRPAVQDHQTFLPAGGETAAISLPSGTALISVSPRSAPPPAYCISLVSATQANDLSSHSPAWPYGCCGQLLVSELASSPGPIRHGYTSLVTQASSVQPHCLPSAVAFVAAAAAAASASGTQPSQWTAAEAGAEAIGSAHATATPMPVAAAAAAVLATAAAKWTSGGGPPLPSVRMLLNTVAPHMILGDGIRILALPTTHHRLQRTYELRASAPGGDHGRGMHDMLVLILAPPSMLRLLRSEQWVTKSEAVVVRWIRGVLLSGGSPSQGVAQQRRGVKAAEADLSSYPDVCGLCGTKRQHCQVRTQDELFLKDVDLLRLLPALIDHSQSSRQLGSAYNLLSHLGGLSLISLPRGLTLSERQHVDFQAGRFIRRLSLLQSPSGKFGPAVSVLCPTAVTQGRAGGGMEKPGGMNRWSLAFHAILEGILRDAEDMAVTISYQAIRRHFRRLRVYLDAVTVARLVILDAAHDSNVMAERDSAPTQQDGRNKSRIEVTGLVAGSDGEGGGVGDRGNDDGWDPASIRVTGLRDWSNCTFGDPLMAMVFSEEPSEEFLRGFTGRRQLQEAEDEQQQQQQQQKQQSRADGGDGGGATCDMLTMCGDIIEYPEEAHIRLLLYECYHATVAVVKEFYRPRSDSMDRELAARKRLHAVLVRLENVRDGPKRRHIRPVGEMSPAKKTKTEDEEDDDDNGGCHDDEDRPR